MINKATNDNKIKYYTALAIVNAANQDGAKPEKSLEEFVDLGSTNEDTEFTFDEVLDGIELSKNDNTIFELLDTDKNGALTDKEISAFTSLNESDRTQIEAELDTIFQSLDEDKDGELSKTEMKNLDIESEEGLNGGIIKKLMVLAGLNINARDKKLIEDEMAEANEMEIVPDIMPSKSSSAFNSLVPSSINSTEIPKPKTESEYKSEIAAKEQEKQQIEAQTEAQIQQAEANIKTYLTEESVKLSPEVMAQFDTENARIESLITEQDTQIQTQTQIEQENTALASAADSAISQFENLLGDLSSRLQNTQQSIVSNDYNRISGKISNLKQEITTKKTEKQEAETKAQQAKQEKEKAEKQKEQYETEKSELLDKIVQENMANIPADIQQKIADEKTKIETLKTNLKAKIDKIDSEIQELKNGLAELEKQSEVNNVVEKNTESLFDKNGDRIGERKMPQTVEEFEKYGIPEDEINDFNTKWTEELKNNYIDLVDFMREQGYTITLTSGYRTSGEQAAIYAGGTNQLGSAPGTSPHEFGVAVDIRIYDANGNKQHSLSPVSQMAGQFWMNRGYRWLGARKQKTEGWHFDVNVSNKELNEQYLARERQRGR